MLRLTQEEMTRQWLLLTRHEPLRADCRVTRSDGIDLETLARTEMRMWYLGLLASAPAEWLEVSEMADDARVEITAEGTVLVHIPAKCVRPISVSLYGWERPASIVAPDSPAARMQTNPFSRGGICRPVAVLRPGGRELEIFSAPAPAAARLKSLRGIADSGDDLYVFREDALSTIQEFANTHML